MPKKNEYSRKEFLEITGLSRQNLNHHLHGQKGGKPLLIEGKDYEKKFVFFKSAVDKIKAKSK